MTRTEIENKLKDLNTRLFYIEMVDRWTWEDKELFNKVSSEIRELEKTLKEMV